MSVLYTDLDPFVCEVLRARVSDGSLPAGDVVEQDVTTLDPRGYTQVHLFCGIGGIPLGMHWAGWPEDWSIVTGGFPCQDVSVAGKGLGVDKGARSGLWKEMHRVIDTVRPTWVLAENVPALRTRGADRVLGDLEQLGYACWPLVVGAEHVGAPHRRHRVWIVGRLDEPNCRMRDGRQYQSERGPDRRTAADGTGKAGGGRMSHPQQHGRGAGSGEQGDEGRAGRGRCQSAGGVQLAETPLGGLGADRSARGHAGHADEREQAVANGGSIGPQAAMQQPGHGKGETRNGQADEPGGVRLVHATEPGLEGLGADAGQPQQRECRRAGPPMRWPAPPGPYQHDWEAPRIIESGMGGAVDGLPRRVAGYLRRSGLKDLGNAVVPQVVEVVARGMIEFGRTEQ